MKLRRKSLGILFGIMCILAMFQINVKAANKNQIRVIIENQTWKTKNAPWIGKKIDTYVDITKDMTADSAIIAACEKENISYDYMPSFYGGYYFNGFADIFGGSASAVGDGISGKEYWDGWMISINDWFMDQGSSNYKISDGSLKAGDEIKVMFSLDGGPDLGGDYSDKDKTLKNLTFSTGSLYQNFSSDIKNYTLTVPDATKEIKVTPTANNKYFQVKSLVGSKEYSRNDMIPVGHGTKLQIVCGKKGWPTSVSGADEVEGEVYTITIQTKKGLAKSAVAKKVTVKAKHQSYQSIKLTWKKTSNVSGYKIYRKSSKTGTYKKIKTTKKNSYTDQSLKTGKGYYYKIRAYKKYSGTVYHSPYSNVKKITVLPGKATIKKVSRSGNTLKVAWKKVSGATGYRVYIREQGEKKYTVAYRCGKDSLSCRRVLDSKRKKYDIKVRAYRKINGKRYFGRFSKKKIV